MDGDLCEEKNQVEIVPKSPRSIPNSPKIPADLNLSQHKLKGKIEKRSSSKSASGLTSLTSAAQCSSSQMKKNTKLTFKDQQMNRLVFQEGGLPDGSEVVYVSRGQKLLKGYKWGRGIFCFCCNTEVSPSQFEAHAGQASRKKPYGNIFVSNGVSLQEYASSLKLTCGHLSKKNDELCGVCRAGGDLLPCDGCPRSFHKECVSETSMIPMEKWFCKYCRNSMKCLGLNGNGGIEQIAKRAIRIVYNPDKCDLVACCVCRAYDFSQVGFNDRTVIVCDQCEMEFHIGCLREFKKIELKELPLGNWFCTADCGRLHSVLQYLVTCGPHKVSDSLMGYIINKMKDNIVNLDMKWILVRGKDVCDQNKLLLTEAVDIFHKCFNPIVDTVTGSDFIPSMAYGLTMGDSDFSGVHCAMLTIDSKVVTAGMFRVFGKDVAELPIVATSEANQGKGYFQLFFRCFEKLVSYLNVKKIVVPAAEDVKSMWTNKLGFEKVPPNQLSEYRQTLTSMVAFQGTSLLEKEVSPSQFEAHDGEASSKNPYGNFSVSKGVSLHECASSLKLTCGHQSKKNDELCGVCREGGDVLSCDGCPRSFHKECVSETSIIPMEKWFCKYCRNSKKCLGQNGNDGIEQIAKRAIRIVYNPDKCDLVACCVCRAYDFSQVGFNDRTVIVCDQCEMEFHIGCLKEHKKIDLKELPSGNWFCTADCGRLHSILQYLVIYGPHKVPDSLMGYIKNKMKDNIVNLDMKWILVRGKDVYDQNKLLLTEAVDIFHKCFNPIVDTVTGSDFIPSMAYGLTMGDTDFSGVHCAMLTIESKVVTAGMFRVFGKDVAELPIVATSEANQGKGYFQLFFRCFEKLVSYLNVKKIVVPAGEDVKSIWTNKLGFEKVPPNQLSEYRQTLTSMVAFQGTSLLEKEVHKGHFTFEDGVIFSLSVE